nr:dynactin subunit [Hymenolepis microstoma]
MSVDPKFANLPWIAHDEPDVYETDDLPEADQRKSESEVEQILPKEIESTSISAEKARQRFEHCKVDGKDADFSDKITGCGKVGYAVECSEYESNPFGDRESTLSARFQRLQSEVLQLINDAETIKKEASGSASSGELTVEQISALASSLTTQLSRLQLEDIFGPNLDLTDLCAHDAVLQKRLFEQIESFKPKQAPHKDGKPDESITFELFSKPSDKVDAANEKALELDRRLQRLEALIGSREVSVIGPGGLVDTAARLVERVALLQPSYLEQVEARIATLQTKLANTTKNSESSLINDADNQTKIGELFDIVKKWDSFSTDLPLVIDRLRNLKALHEQASEFSTSLVNMDVSQKKIDANLAAYEVQLKSAQESLSNALETFKENAQALEKCLKT